MTHHHAPPEAYEKLRSILLNYASRITVDGILGTAVKRAAVDPAHVDTAGLERLITELSVGIRVFCRAEDVPKMMLELAGLFE